MKVRVISGGKFVPLLSTRLWSRNHLPCNCLVVENGNEVHLIDSGLHPRMMNAGLGGQLYRATFGIQIDRKNSLKGQLEVHGLSVSDVQSITLTHLHPDHTAGLIDFPHADIYMAKEEHKYVTELTADNFYKQHFDEKHWQHSSRIHFLEFSNQSWNGFRSAALPHIGNDARLVELPGHTGGAHSGVAIRVAEKWIFHVGDAYFLRDDLHEKLSDRHLTSEIVQAAISPNTPLRHQTVQKIRQLKAKLKDELILISSHEELDSDQIFSE